MIRGKKYGVIRHFVMGSMPELIQSFARQQSAPFQIIQVGIETDFPECDHHLHFLKSFNFPIEEWCAVGQFFWQRLVVRRGAAGSGSNVQVAEPESIITMRSSRLIRKASFVQNGVHEVTGRIASEGTPRTVRAVGAGRKAYDQNAGSGIAESWNRFTPVAPLSVRASFFAGDLLAVRHQARAAGTDHDFAV